MSGGQASTVIKHRSNTSGGYKPYKPLKDPFFRSVSSTEWPLEEVEEAYGPGFRIIEVTDETVIDDNAFNSYIAGFTDDVPEDPDSELHGRRLFIIPAEAPVLEA